MSEHVICGSTCGHRHDSLNGPTGCCREHGPYMYFCNDCHERWKRDNPRTAAAIADCAAGKGSSAKVRAARKADEQNRAVPVTGSDRERDVRLAAVVTHTRTSTDNGPDYCAECSEAISEWVKWPCPRSGREARKFGADTPHEPTDEFVVQAFAEGARYLWPDSRDPGWHVTFRRWLAAHDKAIAARALRSLRDHCDVRAGAPVAPGCPAAGDRQFWIRMAAAIDDYLNGSENA